jgi:hypothetical protein
MDRAQINQIVRVNWAHLPNDLIIAIIKMDWQRRDLAQLPYKLMGKIIRSTIPDLWRSAGMTWAVNDQTHTGMTWGNDTNVGETTLAMRPMSMLEYLRELHLGNIYFTDDFTPPFTS